MCTIDTHLIKTGGRYLNSIQLASQETWFAKLSFRPLTRHVGAWTLHVRETQMAYSWLGLNSLLCLMHG